MRVGVDNREEKEMKKKIEIKEERVRMKEIKKELKMIKKDFLNEVLRKNRITDVGRVIKWCVKIDKVISF